MCGLCDGSCENGLGDTLQGLPHLRSRVLAKTTEAQLQQGPGDILVFLTGREEIDRCISELAELIPTSVT